VAPIDAADFIKTVRVVALEFSNDQCFSNIGLAMNDHARHAFAFWRRQKLLEPAHRLHGAGIVNSFVGQTNSPAGH
jgi:hypothetical protein